jgi:hypothetical protein
VITKTQHEKLIDLIRQAQTSHANRGKESYNTKAWNANLALCLEKALEILEGETP